MKFSPSATVKEHLNPVKKEERDAKDRFSMGEALPYHGVGHPESGGLQQSMTGKKMFRPYPWLCSRGRGERCADYFLVFAAVFAAFFVAFFAATGALVAAFSSTFFAMVPPFE